MVKVIHYKRCTHVVPKGRRINLVGKPLEVVILMTTNVFIS